MLCRIEESNEEDGHDLGPLEIYEYLSRVMYARRSKFNPLWNSMIVGGYKDNQGWVFIRSSILFLSNVVLSFLGYVDLLGTTYSASTIATGYGSMIAIPLLRKAVEGHETTMTEEEGKALLIECMKVLFYRDARSLNKVRLDT
jgi:20S proteasome subunit beta 7